MGSCIKSIREGAEVSFQSCGLSALFYASFYGHEYIIDYLVNCGAGINEKNLTGVTPLGKAVESGRPDVINTVKCLLKHRADPSIYNTLVITSINTLKDVILILFIHC